VRNKKNSLAVMLSSAKRLVFSVTREDEILRLPRQDDIATQSEGEEKLPMTTRYLMAALIALFAGLIILPSAVFSQSDFYKGKTITIIQGRDPGGTGDMRVRTIILFLAEMYSGNPNSFGQCSG
jgi:hypothetical protein